MNAYIFKSQCAFRVTFSYSSSELHFAESKVVFLPSRDVVTQTSSGRKPEGGDVKAEVNLAEGATKSPQQARGPRVWPPCVPERQEGSSRGPPPPSSRSLKVPHALYRFPHCRQWGQTPDGVPRKKVSLKNTPFTTATTNTELRGINFMTYVIKGTKLGWKSESLK